VFQHLLRFRDILHSGNYTVKEETELCALPL